MEKGTNYNVSYLLRYIGEDKQKELDSYIQEMNHQDYQKFSDESEVNKTFASFLNEYLSRLNNENLANLRSYTGLQFRNVNAVLRNNWNYEVNSTQHFYVDAILYIDRIDKDTSNADKCLLDAITETQLIWKDDNVACFRPNRIYYDSNNARIELTIYPVDYIGIFDNQEQLNEFEDKCKTCSRYKRNCSILKKAKEGRIQEEIQDLHCSKYKKVIF